jgi:hypothetical protein
MTEEQWLRESAYSQFMARCVRELGHAKTKAGRRRFRLFACACCRLVWPLFQDDKLRAAVETAEQFADGLVNAEALATAEAATRTLSHHAPVVDIVGYATHAQAFMAAYMITVTPLQVIHQLDIKERSMCGLLRCIFGNPFRPVVAEPSWRSPTVLRLSQGLYESRTFDDLPILGDALEDAGCTNAALLEHCRSDGPHARGCWAVDLALGNA